MPARFTFRQKKGCRLNILGRALGLDERKNESPFPWQEALLARFLEGIGQRSSLDIPTGLGKTGVMAVWLVARSQRALLPRRLVYVVDRRAVVDQATREAIRLRNWVNESPDVKSQLGLAREQALPISTLRGQFADNREWLDDPSAPAIIVGTVDMIGSRLLFEGYGVSRKMRPYHAGMLGADTLFVLDEAHLVPPFEALLESLVTDSAKFHPQGEAANLVPRMKLLSLSATGRNSKGQVWGLSDTDLQHPTANKRLNAAKKLIFRQSDYSRPLAELLAEEAWELAEGGSKAARIIVFSNLREVAEKAKEAVEKLAKDQGIGRENIQSELFVGARRVHERGKAAKWLADHGFLAGSKEVPQHPTFLFATSAGEVGVDLDADHMVCDLVEWERMVQRLGRVNRRGDGSAEVHVLLRTSLMEQHLKLLQKSPSSRTKNDQEKVAAALSQLERFQRPLMELPHQEGGHNASPAAIRALTLRAKADGQLQALVEAAMSERPLRPALTRPVVDAWSMTSLEKHSGRPWVAPWLRGWVSDDPQTTVIWRRYLPVCENSSATEKKQKADATEFFEHAPPHLSEMLEVESFQVFNWLTKRAKAVLKKLESMDAPPPDSTEQPAALRRSSVIAIVLNPALAVQRFISLEELAFDGDDKNLMKRRKTDMQRSLCNNTLVVDERFGGLNEEGLLDHGTTYEPSITGDDADWKTTGFSVRRITQEDSDAPAANEDSGDGSESRGANWRTSLKFVARTTKEGEPVEWLLVEKERTVPTSEDARAIAKALQPLQEHQRLAEDEAGRIAEACQLEEPYQRLLKIVARLHDEGKRAARWQNAFSAPRDGRPYAKTMGPVKTALLDGYRHEFGSLPLMAQDPEFQSLDPMLQDLALHLVAAHHGYARPVIRITGCEDAPPSVLKRRARDVALRFARLQQYWGPWGLAWWESLLRAADQRASRKLDERPAS